jgi:hypothetical protein
VAHVRQALQQAVVIGAASAARFMTGSIFIEARSSTPSGYVGGSLQPCAGFARLGGIVVDSDAGVLARVAGDGALLPEYEAAEDVKDDRGAGDRVGVGVDEAAAILPATSAT